MNEDGKLLASKRTGTDKYVADFRQVSGELRVLGKGNVGGEIRAGEFDVIDEKGEIRRLKLAIKRYEAPWLAQAALRNYDLCLKAGLPVLPIFQLADDNRTIVMTDLSRGGRCVAESGNDVSKFETDGVKLTGIENLDALVSQLSTIIHKASAANIRLFADTIFFVFLRGEGSASIMCAIGDYDIADDVSKVSLSRPLLEMNKIWILSAFKIWIRRRNKDQGGGLESEKLIQYVESKLS